jgi:Ca2+-binding RTX toxin-like protein
MRTTLFVAAALVALLAVPSFAYAAPANDDFADAVDLSAIDPENGAVEGTNVGASKELGEPDHAGNPGGHSVWYTWTAPGDGSIPNIAFTTGFSEFDTLLAAYTGVAVGALTEVASNDDATGLGNGSSVSFATTPGTTYAIAVDGFQGKVGRFFLDWDEAPANDNFADAILLTGAAGTQSGNSGGATSEAGEQVHAAPVTVWYTWTPPADGTYKFSTIGSRFDTVLSIYTGSSLENLQLVVENDDDPDRGCCSSWVPLVNADASTTYSIQVSALAEDGRAITLSWGPLILGTRGSDTLVGTAGAEEIRARGGSDNVSAGGGADLVFGGGGNDVLRGNGGNDLVFDHRGTDLLMGQTGADRLDAKDRRPGDTLIGGPGADVCLVSLGDSFRGC